MVSWDETKYGSHAKSVFSERSTGATQADLKLTKTFCTEHVYMLTIINMATVRNFDVITDQLNAAELCMYRNGLVCLSKRCGVVAAVTLGALQTQQGHCSQLRLTFQT